jgi:hypothetical protein
MRLKTSKIIMIGLLVLGFFTLGQQLTAQSSSLEKSNGVFEIISFSKDSVKFKAVSETKLYSVALMLGEQAFEAKFFSNSEGTVQWANGSRFRPGSYMPMPAASGVDAVTLPKGAILTVSGFQTKDNFKATKIRFTTEGTNRMDYDIQKSAWNAVK